MFMPKAPGFASMLKEGSKHLEGVDDVVIRNIDACVTLSKLTRTSYGPCGQYKFIINHLEKLAATSDAATVVNELEIQHPAARLIGMASQQQDKEIGDGTNLVMLLASSMLSRAASVIRIGLNPIQVLSGYEIALTQCLTILKSMAEEKKVKNLKEESEIIKYLKPVIATKYFGGEDVLAELVAKACIGTVRTQSDLTSFNVDNVRVCKVPGGSVDSSFSVNGLMLKSNVEGSVQEVVSDSKVCPVKIAVYSCPIDIATLETKGTVLFKNAEELLSFSHDEENNLKKQLEAVAKTGIKVIVSGSKFSDLALHYINQMGLMAIRVMSKFELRRIARSCGAFVHPQMSPPEIHEIGLCESIKCQQIGETTVVVIEISKEQTSSPLMTIVLRASTDQVLDDLERAVDDGVNAYKALTRDPSLVPGGGACEIELAKQLTDYANTLSESVSIERYAVRAFGEAFELPVRIMVDNAGLNGTDLLAKLYAAHATSTTGTDVGIRLPDGNLMKASEDGLYDSYVGKLWAIKLAYEAVTSVLRVDQIIMAKPAGGPEAKENKAWDEN